MTELGIVSELLKGGTTAGILLVVGWFVLQKWSVLQARQRKDDRERLDAFLAALSDERNAHKDEVGRLSADIRRMADSVLIAAKEVNELRRDVRGGFSEDDVGEVTPHHLLGDDERRGR